MELPPPWELRESTKYPGRCYYFNNDTHESTWIRPTAYPGHRLRIWPPAIFVLHILVTHQQADTRAPLITRTRAEAQERAKAIWANLLKSDTAFEDAAKEESDDAATREAGGVIGWIKPKTMPAEFDEAAWQLGVGEMSAPVPTRLGWHLILRRG
jgi:parvulin-like peptidyl-prolyl isomerase